MGKCLLPGFSNGREKGNGRNLPNIDLIMLEEGNTMPDFRKFNQELYSEQSRINRLKVKRLRKTRLLLSTLVILLFFGAAAYGALWAFGAVQVGGLEFDRSTARAAESKPSDDEIIKGRVNILIMGVDRRKDEPTRADTLMVAMVDLTEKKIDLVSIPRDTRVAIEGVDYKTRINHAHAYGGVDLTKQTVEQFLGIPIHYYVESYFQGFINTIDIIGGLDLDVEQRMYNRDEDIDLKKGYQHLDGRGALGYVRFRDGEGDLGRIERQQKFVAVLADKVFKPSIFFKLPSIAWEMHRNVLADLSVSEGIYLTSKLKSAGSGGIIHHTLPGTPKYIGGASYYVAEDEEVAAFIDNILNPVAAETAAGSGQSESQ